MGKLDNIWFSAKETRLTQALCLLKQFIFRDKNFEYHLLVYLISNKGQAITNRL